MTNSIPENILTEYKVALHKFNPEKLMIYTIRNASLKYGDFILRMDELKVNGEGSYMKTVFRTTDDTKWSKPIWVCFEKY